MVIRGEILIESEDSWLVMKTIEVELSKKDHIIEYSTGILLNSKNYKTKLINHIVGG